MSSPNPTPVPNPVPTPDPTPVPTPDVATDPATELAGRTVLVTGAARGLGRALIAEALARGAERVYAGVRRPAAHLDPRVVAVPLDITDAAQVAAAAKLVERLDLLVNNAGVAEYDDLGDPDLLARHLAVNLYGPRAVTQAFLPQLIQARGAVVNVLSVAALAALPMIPAYSISKAAAFSLTQAQRALLAPSGVRVHAVLAGPVDTEMSRDLDVPKASPEAVARAVLDGVAAGDEEIFPDPMSAALAPGWAAGAVKAMERGNTALLAAAG